MNLVHYNAKADQWAADCERMGREQCRAKLADEITRYLERDEQ